MIGIILGTRPEIIKMSPIIRECETRGLEYNILHTGQHYSFEMDQKFFAELELPEPRYCLNVRSGTHAEQTAKIMVGIEKILMEQRPDIVLVQGDTNTVLASVLASAKIGIRIGHVEAGLRSYDRMMPEEVNRVIADHVSDFLFAPTDTARGYLLKEGIEENRITVTGNTIVDAVKQNLELSKRKSDILVKMKLEHGRYFLVTSHRQENVDSPENLQGIIAALQSLHSKYSFPVVFPMHPRTRKMIEKFRLAMDGITVISPIGFLDFLCLEANAALILTDSGGVQEEACILGVPCVTLRENTERPETIKVGANMLSGTNSIDILECAQKMLEQNNCWVNPYGDGTTGKIIVDICEDFVLL